jgi:hypothetical protein
MIIMYAVIPDGGWVESKSTGTEPAPPLPLVPMAVAPPPEEPLVSMDGTLNG